MSTDTEFIAIPRDLFLALVWLQASYASQLNLYDGGGRMPVHLSNHLQSILTPRERHARKPIGDHHDQQER